MKHGKRLSRGQKALLASWGLDPGDWLSVKRLPYELHIIHRLSGTRIVIRKRIWPIGKRIGIEGG